MPNTIKTYQQTGVFEQLMLSGKKRNINYPRFIKLSSIQATYKNYLLFIALLFGFGELNFINISIDPLTTYFFIHSMYDWYIPFFGSAVTIF